MSVIPGRSGLYLILLPILLNTFGILSEFHGADAFLQRLRRRTQTNEQMRQRVTLVEAGLEDVRQFAVAIRYMHSALKTLTTASRQKLAITAIFLLLNLAV